VLRELEGEREGEDLCDLSLKACVSFSPLCPFFFNLISLLVGSKRKISPGSMLYHGCRRIQGSGKEERPYPRSCHFFCGELFFLFSLSISIGCGGGRRRAEEDIVGAKGKQKKGKWEIRSVRQVLIDGQLTRPSYYRGTLSLSDLYCTFTSSA